MYHHLIAERYGGYVTIRDRSGAPIILGEGAFGPTVRAFGSRWRGGQEVRDEVAIKLFTLPVLEPGRPQHRFIARMMELRPLKHPNLVRHLHCGEQDGVPFLVMEYCRGGDLEQFVRDAGPLSERATLQVLLEVCAALEEGYHLHRLHLDLKPRNLLVGEHRPAAPAATWLAEGLAQAKVRLQVADFGLLHALIDARGHSAFAGTPMYASPEQARAEPDLDLRSDIYSLGLTLWFLLTGKAPLLRPDGAPIESPQDALQAHASPEPHDSRLPETLSPPLRALLVRMLKKPREERFGSLEEVTIAAGKILDPPKLPKEPRPPLSIPEWRPEPQLTPSSVASTTRRSSPAESTTFAPHDFGDTA